MKIIRNWEEINFQKRLNQVQPREFKYLDKREPEKVKITRKTKLRLVKC